MAVADPGGLLEPIDLAAFGPVIPVIVIDRAEQAVPMARALVDGGVRVLEVTLRTAAAVRAIASIARNAAGVRSVTSSTRTPPSTRARAIGTARSA